MSDGGVKFTWTVRLADCSDSQMLRERGKHDSQLAKMGRAAQDVRGVFQNNPESLKKRKLRPHLENCIFSFYFMRRF